ncbi:MAG: DUF2309 domain-containing protein [Polyangiaceae bacterium]
MKTRQLHAEHVESVLARVTRRVAPVWPLDRFVAVNPYLGLLDQPFEDVVHRLGQVSAARSTLAGADYLNLIEEGELSIDVVDEVLAESRLELSREELFRLAAEEGTNVHGVRTVTEVLDGITDGSWSRWIRDHLGAWMAAYFDHDFATWQPSRTVDLFSSWKSEAELDLTPEVLGAPGFRKLLEKLPNDWSSAVRVALQALGVEGAALDLYLHRLLMQLGGWSAHAARLAWERRLRGEPEGDTQSELLAVLVVVEFALKESLLDKLDKSAWQAEVQALSDASRAPVPASVMARVVLQQAYERSAQLSLSAQFEQQREVATPSDRPHLQAVFCIDVRSEVFRRHLEAAAEGVETLGFAGFFGFPVDHIDLGNAEGIPHCPVLLSPSHRVASQAGDETRTKALAEAKLQSTLVGKAVKSFKLGSISCFGFVSPLGLAYLPKLLTDAFGLTRPVPKHDSGLEVALTPSRRDGQSLGIPVADQIKLAANALKGMSLRQGFARLILIAGHGATSVNNPHASGLDCGACGGRAGAVNARVAATVLNNPEVRAGLEAAGIHIPEDTYFLAGLHDTTTDEVTLFEQHLVPAGHASELEALKLALGTAGGTCRTERARRLGGNTSGETWFERSRDWAQIRPEWGLAGCASFIAAPRQRTSGVNLNGRAFLHSYSWEDDPEFAVLETIMTAPMVVASWINLQYYASSVDPEIFGAGNKTLHNVVGGNLGVLEGNTGDLRVGLPWQSIHDGERLQHTPLRLSVFVEAPTEAMSSVIARHQGLQHLLDNGWIHLFALNQAGRVTKRYAGGGAWVDWPHRARATSDDNIAWSEAS